MNKVDKTIAITISVSGVIGILFLISIMAAVRNAGGPHQIAVDAIKEVRQIIKDSE